MDTIHHFDDELHTDFLNLSTDFHYDNYHDIDIDNDIDMDMDNDNDIDMDMDMDDNNYIPTTSNATYNANTISTYNTIASSNATYNATYNANTTTQFFGFSNRLRFSRIYSLIPSFSHIIFVESPAKARFFSHFLPSHFFIFPTFGSFFFFTHLKHILSSFHIHFFLKPFAQFAKLFSTFLHLFFATDTDRDGESFSHIFLFPIYATVIKKCI
jgi:hypothetical protein